MRGCPVLDERDLANITFVRVENGSAAEELVIRPSIDWHSPRITDSLHFVQQTTESNLGSGLCRVKSP